MGEVTAAAQAAGSLHALSGLVVHYQKAYDTVQHHLLWDKLESIGVGSRMLAAIRSLYSSGTLSGFRVGLLDLPSPGISAAALCAGPGHWGMNGILFLTAPILPTFVASFGRCIKMLMVPCSVLCGTRTRKLSAIA